MREVLLQALEDGIYKIALALVTICDTECSDYGYTEAYEIAEEYIKNYEEDRKNA